MGVKAQILISFITLEAGITLYGEANFDLLNAPGNAFNFENISGSGLDDILYGDNESNVIIGASSDDKLYGRGGADLIFGDRHKDFDENIKYGVNVTHNNPQGNDVIYGGSGDDTLYGNDGDDNLYGEEGSIYYLAEMVMIRSFWTIQNIVYPKMGMIQSKIFLQIMTRLVPLA